MKLRLFLPLAAVTLLFPLGIMIAKSGQVPALAESPSVSTAILAQQPEPSSDGQGNRPRGGRGERMNQIFQQLNLTPQQSERIQDIRQQSQQSKQDLRQQMKAAHEQMQSLMAQDTPTEELRQQHQQIQNLRRQMADQRFETMLQIREELTPEQRTKLSELKPKQGRHFGKFRQQS